MQPNLRPLWGSPATVAEVGIEVVVVGPVAEAVAMETSDRRGTWGMASQRASLEANQTRHPVRVLPAGKGTHLERSEWGGVVSVISRDNTFMRFWSSVVWVSNCLDSFFFFLLILEECVEGTQQFSGCYDVSCLFSWDSRRNILCSLNWKDDGRWFEKPFVHHVQVDQAADW